MQQQIKSVTFDSRAVESQSLFVALKGEGLDGHDYIESAIEGGAISVLCEVLPSTLDDRCTYLQTQDSHKALGILASNFYGNPSYDLKVIGVTGTNGKTSVATMLYGLFQSLGYPAGLLSTVKVCYGGFEKESTRTTPDPLQIQAHLAAMKKAELPIALWKFPRMGLLKKEFQGFLFSGGVFTNLTHDHLDYHKTFAAYRDTKKIF